MKDTGNKLYMKDTGYKLYMKSHLIDIIPT